MTSILCLAHFCEVHGPTPLMVTEGLPVRCQACDDQEAPGSVSSGSAESSMGSSEHSAVFPSSSTSQAAATAAVAEAIRKMNLGPSQPHSQHKTYNTGGDYGKTLTGSNDFPAAAKAPTNTRPSPSALSSQTPATPPFDSSSHFRKTYDESVTKRALPCHNCAMTLPRDQPRSRANGAGSPAPRNPTLRTRVPCARVYDEPADDVSPLFLQPSSFSTSSCTSSDSEDDDRLSSRAYGRYSRRRRGTMTSVSTSRSSASSAVSRATNSHTHYLEYTSTHEPTGANAYYIIRASCLRTLTLESIPRPPLSSGSATPVNLGAGPGGAMMFTSQQPPFSSVPSYLSPFQHGTASAAAAAAAANGGPLFFGDSSAGYTTAHVFRVADVHARGHKRVYALIALTTHRERVAMKAFGLVSAAFNELAAWIQQLADAEADRIALQSESTTAPSSGTGSPATNTDINGYSVGGSPQVSPPVTQPSSYVNDSADTGSSFLAAAGHGLSRRMGPGYAGMSGLSSSAMAAHRARGLPEILGKPDFFVELHTRFVKILLELGATLNN